MARYTGPVCKLCRREGQKLFLKGQKCYTEKCPVDRRQYPPGQHGPAQARRRKQSDYAVQLREKQKVKRIYGLHEKQFRNMFEHAAHVPGITGENLLVALETRLDNVIFRMGFAPSRSAARQLVRHRHVEVNGRIVDVPSFHVTPGHEIAVKAGLEEPPDRGGFAGGAHASDAARVAGAGREDARGPDGENPDAHGHTAPRSGTADRRALLEVIRAPAPGSGAGDNGVLRRTTWR